MPVVVLVNHSVLSDSWDPVDCSPTRLLCPWDSPGKDTGVGCHVLLQFLPVGPPKEYRNREAWRAAVHGVAESNAA